MNYFDIPDKEFDELYNTKIEELEFSVRTYNTLKRCGCETLADVAYLTIEELQKAKNVTGRTLKDVQEKLAERNISLMTQEERQQLLDEADNAMILRRQNMILEGIKQKNQETIRRYQRENDAEWNEVRANRTRALKEARGIVRTSPYPIARLLEDMYFGLSAKEGCRFCAIFELWNEYGCLVEVDSMEGNDLTHSCEECIETFLADYYWGKRMSAKIAAERGEVPKVIRMDTRMGDVRGRCPVCKQLMYYDSYVHYCCRCGSILNWDEENWDEEKKMSWHHDEYDVEDDDDEYDVEDVDGDEE